MLVAMIRPTGTHTATVEGADIPELRAQLLAGAPAGWDMVSAHVEMKPGGIRIVTGKFEPQDAVQEIEAEGMAALEAKVPDGWQMLSIRRT